MTNAPCPQCRGPSDLSASNRFRPFCSERCKLLDLGEWFEEDRRIPGPDMPGADAQDELPER